MTIQQTSTGYPLCGRCFTYPQGQISFLPQLLAAAAVLCAFMAFSFEPRNYPWLYHADYFVCLQIKYKGIRRALGTYDSGYDTSSSLYHDCFPLELHSETYWNEDDDDHWAWALRLATLIAIFSFCFGAIGTILLLSATCFPLSSRTLKYIIGLFLAAAPLAFFTLIAGATNLCKMYEDVYPQGLYPDAECNRNGTGVRLADGATLMIFAGLFYIAAAVFTFLYRQEVLEQESENDAGSKGVMPSSTAQETAPLFVHANNPFPHQPVPAVPVVRTIVEQTPEGLVTTEETTNPDGTKTIKITKDDTATSSPTRSPRHHKAKKKRSNRRSSDSNSPPDTPDLEDP